MPIAKVVFMGTKRIETTDPKKWLFQAIYVSVQMYPSLHGLHTVRYKLK
jgi:hypothetical protein